MDNATDGRDPRERLRVINDELATLHVSAIFILALLMVIGLVGNGVACYIFSFRLRMCTQHFLIIWLAVFDLLSCSVAMPAEIVDIRYFIMYPDELACRLLRFVNHFCSFASIFTLIVIAVDRYRKVCRPLKQQMSPKHAKIAMTGVIVVGVAYAMPAPLLYGLQSNETLEPGVYGYDCSTSDKVRGTLFPLLYNSLLFLSFLVILVVLSVIYVRIWREMKRHKRYMSRSTTSRKDSLYPDSHSESSSTTTSDHRKQSRNVSHLVKFKKADVHNPASVSSVTDTESFTDTEDHADLIRPDHSQRYVKPVAPSESVKMTLQTKKLPTACKAVDTSALKTNVCDRNSDHSGLGKDSFDLLTNESIDVRGSLLLHGELQDYGMRGFVSASYMDGSPSSADHCFESSKQFRSTESCARTNQAKMRKEEYLKEDKQEEKTDYSYPARHTEKHNTKCESESPAKKARSSHPPGAIKTHKATVIAMSVTVVFFLSFLPHLSLVTARIIKADLEAELQGVPLVVYNIFLRSYFINSVANPIIYGVLNKAFRAQCHSLVRRLCSCRK